MILSTERLYLREMEPSDFEALCAMLQDKEVMYAYEHAFSDEEAWDWLNRQISRYRSLGHDSENHRPTDRPVRTDLAGFQRKAGSGSRIPPAKRLLAPGLCHRGGNRLQRIRI